MEALRALQGCPQAPDLFSPAVYKAILLGVLAVVPHAPLTERELVLRVHERRRCAAPHAVDAARAKDAITKDLLIFARAHCAPDLPRQLFTDNSPFPHTASPQSKRRDQQEW